MEIPYNPVWNLEAMLHPRLLLISKSKEEEENRGIFGRSIQDRNKMAAHGGNSSNT